MPITPFILNANDTDAALRRQFVDYTRNLLDYIVQNVREDESYAELVHPKARDYMQSAWQEWQEASPHFFENLVPMVQNPDNNNAFINHGLSGNQLKFKLANVEWWSQQVQSTEQNSQMALWMANIKRLLDSIDPVINSILEALGDGISGVPGAGSALVEIKDTIKETFND